MGVRTVLEREQHVQRPCGGREHRVFEAQRGRSACWSAAREERWVMSLKKRTLARLVMAL